jgi:hypothetical protein
MKTGLTLQQMAAELERRNEAKRDFIADTGTLTVSHTPETPVPMMSLALTSGAEAFEPTETFRRQLATHYKVPQEYAERVRHDHPQLYATTFNTFLGREPARRMVRTLDGNARAFLSDRYRPLDNYDLSQAVLPQLMDHKDIRIESTQFTESRFYIKAVVHSVVTEVRKGDVIAMGIAISNSEVGAGALSVEPYIDRLWCLNGAIFTEYGQRKYHVGKRAVDEEAAFELYSTDTKRLDDAAFFAKVRDTVKGVLTHEVLEKIAQKMRDATIQKIEGVNLQKVVELTAQRFSYNETTSGGILRHLIEGGDLTRYGLMNAITRQSQDEDDYDVATRLEADGAKLIELPRNDWQQIATAALAKAA